MHGYRLHFRLSRAMPAVVAIASVVAMLAVVAVARLSSMLWVVMGSHPHVRRCCMLADGEERLA